MCNIVLVHRGTYLPLKRYNGCTFEGTAPVTSHCTSDFFWQCSLEKTVAPDRLASVSSTAGRMCLSLQILLFRCVKSTQIQILPFSFGTITTPEHHSVTSSMGALTRSSFILFSSSLTLFIMGKGTPRETDRANAMVDPFSWFCKLLLVFQDLWRLFWEGLCNLAMMSELYSLCAEILALLWQVVQGEGSRVIISPWWWSDASNCPLSCIGVLRGPHIFFVGWSRTPWLLFEYKWQLQCLAWKEFVHCSLRWAFARHQSSSLTLQLPRTQSLCSLFHHSDIFHPFFLCFANCCGVTFCLPLSTQSTFIEH